MKNKVNFNDIELPFKTQISFKKVIDFWNEKARLNNEESEKAKSVLAMLEKTPSIAEPFEDHSILTKYRSEICFLLSDLFPEALQLNEIKAATLPFQPVQFCKTRRFENILAKAGPDFELMLRDLEPDFLYRMACGFLLNMHYQINMEIKKPMLFDIPNLETGIVRNYRAFFNADFSEVLENEKTRKLSDAEITQLLDNVDDIDLWKKLIPPRSFTLQGFGLLTIFDVTSDQALSELKFNLIKQDALQSPELLKELEISMRKLLGVPDLSMGIAAVKNDELYSIGGKIWNSNLVDDYLFINREKLLCSNTCQQIFNRKKVLAISNIPSKGKAPSKYVAGLVEKGFKSYIVTPLLSGEKLIGLLELGSRKQNALNSLSKYKLEEIIPLFSIAMERSINNYETRLESIVQEKFTAIHPAVEWRFFEAASNLYHRQRLDEEAIEIEDIVFKDVYPLFGQMDIKGSSTYRDKAIQKDLIEQLSRAKEVINTMVKRDSLFIYEQLGFQIDLHLERLKERLNADDEATIVDFLKTEIDSVFNHVKENIPGFSALIKSYEKSRHETLGIIYKERKAYEDTVTLINERISTYLDKAQEDAQSMFPHYFEKYKTDGIEYNIYVGSALVKDRPFHPLYLKNLRLWQLVTTYVAENLIHQIKSDFKVPLEVASLILVQNRPLDIRFRMDEKQFDVDGAYNVRYEILKKRIDKALVAGTNERLTQPGKLSIVYSSDAERREYEGYLHFLQNKKYFEPEIEYCDLEDLQGASGLKALRVNLRYDKKLSISEVKMAVKELIMSTN